MQRLRMALGRGHGLDAGADDVVVDILRRKAPAAGLAVGAQRQGLRILGRELVLHELRPENAAGPHLGDLHVVVHADGPEEGQARGKRVHVEAGSDGRAHVFDAVGERVAEFQVRRRAGFLHVIAGDRDRVEARHFFRRVADDVRDGAHRGFGRIDIGVPHHELFEDVVLDGAGELVVADACSSPATMKSASTGSTAPFMVMDTET